MTVVPIVFNTENINYMASHSKKLLDLGYIAINPKFSNLITALKGAQFQEFKFLKEDSPNNDLTDTFLMLCGGITFFKFKSTGDY